MIIKACTPPSEKHETNILFEKARQKLLLITFKTDLCVENLEKKYIYICTLSRFNYLSRKLKFQNV